MIEEKRIYVVVAETVQIEGGPVVIQPCGRIAAQCAHVVSKMRMIRNLPSEMTGPFVDLGAYTTIVLAARDSAEMGHLVTLLERQGCPGYRTFMDTNPEYGEGDVLTALCTEPTTRDKVEGILDYLPLWGHGRNSL